MSCPYCGKSDEHVKAENGRWLTQQQLDMNTRRMSDEFLKKSAVKFVTCEACQDHVSEVRQGYGPNPNLYVCRGCAVVMSVRDWLEGQDARKGL